MLFLFMFPYFTQSNENVHVFHPDPNCTGGIRDELKCNYVSDVGFDYNDAMSECIDKGFDPKNLNESDLVAFPWNLFGDNLTMVWVGVADMSRRSKRNGKIF